VDVFDDEDVLHFRREDWRFHRGERRKEFARYLDEVLRSRAYRHLGVNWTEFCQLYVGMSASRAYLLIHEMNGTWRGSAGPIPDEKFPSLARFARKGHVMFDGIQIPVTRENRALIRRVIHAMHTRFLDTRRAWRARQRATQRSPMLWASAVDRETNHIAAPSLE
jgi:hypothetical protein